MNDLLILSTVVVVFATVQSLFGVGLLVFGTPTLLLLGYSFESTIAVLLPASLTISSMQVYAGKAHLGRLKREFVLYCVPFIVMGLALVLTVRSVDMKFVVGLMLVGTALMRCHSRTQRWMSAYLARSERPYMIMMGLVHGLSNMGGGLLTVLVSSTYREKESIRANIAYGYLVFAATQLAVLAALHPAAFSIHSLILSLVALVTFVTVGSLLYLRSPKVVYQHAITALVLAYGVVLIGQKLI